MTVGVLSGIEAGMTHGFYSGRKIPGLCTVWAAKTVRGIVRIDLGGGEKNFLRQLPDDIEWKKDAKKFRAFFSGLKKIAAGKKVSFTDKPDIRRGTPFERRVWDAIATIPRGRTVSYAALAAAAGKPKAARAAANACGKNPCPLIIPCHRVVASNGSLGGFSAGVKLKRKLLTLEHLTYR